MDSDSFYPAFVTAAKVIGLGEYAVKFLRAQGIALTEKEILGNENSISWLHPVTEAIKQRIYGQFAPLGAEKFLHSLFLIAVGESQGQTLLRIDAGDNATLENNRLLLKIGGTIEKLLYDGTARSDFVVNHPPGVKRIETLAGLVQSTGAIIFGTGYTVVRTAVGQYTITFEKAWPAGFAVAGSDAQNAGRVFSYTTLSQTQIAVTMRNQAGGFTTEDVAFSFIVMGSA